MEIDLLDFVQKSKRLAKQALGKHAGEPASGGFARWVHVVLHCFRLEEEHSFRETANRLKYMAEIREVVELDRDDLPDYTTIYKSFDRLKMWVWRALLRLSAQQHPQSGHVALDSTFFDRGHASAYYQKRSNRSVETLKVTTLTDTESLAVLDVQCHAHWRHDTKTGPQVVRRNADDLQYVLADNAFQNWQTEYEYYTLGIEPAIYYRGSSVNAVSNNALIQEYDYTQRWMAETSYSSVKRSLGDAVRARFWYREFREIVLMFAIHNIEQLCEPL
ncbi:IS5 family transposase [Natrarchaeobaculum sulfurireducens]|uniref:IS5 family transposase n=1 Tax=Natrarchaeobaculum sulfurireducens TaxID=2044521 RepID=A0A346P9T5_9EURY|nr:IS5 family transposase [Natrarchaeobaculum sulfurireducens]AXR76280.1 IS5/IS1182 family transposase [Natrarchaeobaculum sulfurireducens]AXR79969.1 IS5 family transposase [Natrarchaeobaculum sulfurireducens]